MTIREVIDRVDGLKPNQYSEEEKVKWLSTLDFKIHNEVLKTHESDEEIPDFVPYTVNDMQKTLLVDAPYDEVYIAYIKLKIDENNQETARYNNSAVLFNSYYSEFINYYQKNHKPIKRAMFRIWG